MKFLTFNNLADDLVENIHKIPRDIDVVVGVPRSGCILAGMIAGYINKPLGDLDSFINGHIYSAGATKNSKDWVDNIAEVKKALIVEDSVQRGTSIESVKARITEYCQNIECVYLAAYVSCEGKGFVDIYFRKIDDLRIFEWNYLHNIKFLKRTCFDLDGVLCMDPTEEENDDGPKYVNFLLNATPKFIPSSEIGWIVTSRLEKYRNETEEWLKKNGIKYRELIMLNLKSAEERRQLGVHADFKAEQYKSLNEAFLFVESNEMQAIKINEITKKSVFCTSNRFFYSESTSKTIVRVGKKKMSKIAKKVLPNRLYKVIKSITGHS